VLIGFAELTVRLRIKPGISVGFRSQRGDAGNPISTVRTSSQRLKDPEILTPKGVWMLCAELEPRERMMVLLAASTGLRRGELIALRWLHIE